MSDSEEREKTGTRRTNVGVKRVCVGGREAKAWSVIQSGVREVPGREADGDEEMDGGGILIISHSQGSSRGGKGAPIGVMVNFHYTMAPSNL